MLVRIQAGAAAPVGMKIAQIGVLARFPLGQNRPSDKKSRHIKILSMFLSQKSDQLLRNML